MFTPELHSANGRWGHLIARVDVGFSPAAVETLLALDVDRYWQHFARFHGLDPRELARDRRWMAAHGKRGRMLRRRIRPGLQRALLRSQRLLGELETARTRRGSEATEAVAAALRWSVYRSGGGFDPGVLAPLRATLGRDAVSVAARVTQPPWREKRLVAGADLVLRTHARPFRIARPPLIFEPHSVIEQYDMLESLTRGTMEPLGRAGAADRGPGVGSGARGQTP